MAVREAELKDIPEMFRVRMAVTENQIDESGLTYLGITSESVAELLQTTGKAWVAEDAGAVVGFSTANLESGSVWAVFVLPEFEGRGLGRRLLNAAVEWLWSQDVDQIWLTTDGDVNTRANGFYRHLGWEPEEQLPTGEIKYVLSRKRPDALAG